MRKQNAIAVTLPSLFWLFTFVMAEWRLSECYREANERKKKTNERRTTKQWIILVKKTILKRLKNSMQFHDFASFMRVNERSPLVHL